MTTVTTSTTSTPKTYKLELKSAYGPVYRDVLDTPPRDCSPEEVPTIDISGIHGDFEARKALAESIRNAAEHTGFFYIKQHGIPEERIQAAFKQIQTFFHQTDELKEKVAQDLHSKYFNGWARRSAGHLSPSESKDYREGFTFRYHPANDPEPKDLDAVPEEVKPYIRGEDFVWEGTSHIPHFKEDMVAYWQECLKLARRMIRIFALALNLPENELDPLVTYPGSDGVFNFYPAMSEEQAASSQDVGIGSHTDLQCFTLLWQDQVGGLQVLNKDGQWVRVPPVPGTFVVNIGDYLMRLTNDRWKSTVHRVWNRSTIDRYSMPFFFGFNFNEKCGVLPSCTDENNPPKYEPISCGEWCQLRIKATFT